MPDSGDSLASQLELRIASDPANLADARRRIEALARACGLDQESCDAVGLCINEALANVIRHAYQGATDRPIQIIAGAADDGLRIAIRDWGSCVNPLVAPPRPRDPLSPGGVGLICLRELMDQVQFIPQGDGMLLVMMRRNGRPKHGQRPPGQE
jgi:serine/threonine-protein kinase RsbW